MTVLTLFIILGLLLFIALVVIWRIRYESIRTRKALEKILEKLTPDKPGTVTKKSLETYQHFFGGK